MNPPLERYVLDTSALLAFYQDEPGSDMVEGILATAGQDHPGIAQVAPF